MFDSKANNKQRKIDTLLIYSFVGVKHLLYIFLISLFWSCSDEQSNHEVSFYHWKSTFKPSEFERSYLNSLNVQKLYVRFFDVKWIVSEKSAFPIAQLQSSFKDSLTHEIVPVVYITNETFQKTASDKIPELAKNVLAKIKILATDNHFAVDKLKEIQFDCDWSLGTKDNYFAFLKAVQQEKEEFFGKKQLQFSSTIRLHQIKYANKTGTPPVDKGVLMFYNMGKLTDTTTTNSILDINTAEKYLYNFDNYDLKFDVALPLFSWGVQFRKGKVVQLLNNLSALDLEENSDLVQQENNYFEVVKNTYINDQYVYKGDRIRFESVKPAQLEQATQMIEEVMNTSNYNLIFYHLDEKVLMNYPSEFLKSL